VLSLHCNLRPEMQSRSSCCSLTGDTLAIYVISSWELDSWCRFNTEHMLLEIYAVLRGAR
jgi:hypothetical protein